MTIDGPHRVLCEFRVVCPPVSLAPLSIKARVTLGGDRGEHSQASRRLERIKPRAARPRFGLIGPSLPKGSAGLFALQRAPNTPLSNRFVTQADCLLAHSVSEQMMGRFHERFITLRTGGK